ncbi:DMT family transporter [Rhodovibrio salinarum]|nr:DMT family transporter [Rhodovibrio salinarum]
MTAAAFGFSCMNALIRAGSLELAPAQIVFFRNVFALAFMLPWLVRVGRAGLTTQRLGMHALRSVIGLTAMTCWFYSVSLLPLAQAVSLNYTVPLFATVGAALVLGETVRARRWTATVLGFLGVLVIVRPGVQEFSAAMALPILAAMFMATAALLIKSLSNTENPNAMVFYMNLLLTPLSLIPAAFVWVWPSWEVLGLMALVGGLATISHLLLTRAYAKADASAVIPFHYMQLPFVALIAFVAFGEVPALWTLLGAAVIAGAAIYITHREARVAKAARQEVAG